MSATAPPVAATPLRPRFFHRVRRMPREARDTLFLLAVIGWSVLPHLGHLPAWAGFLTAAVLLWRARLAVAHAPLPGRWTLAAVLLVAAGLTLWSHKTLLGKDAGVTMAVALMALKTLELRARRDAFVVFFLGFFLILAQFLYSQSLLVALAMLVAVWGLLTALVLAHMPVGQPALAQAGWLAGKTALLGVPIMVLLFLLFPRVGPLWGVPNENLAGTGLSNRMRMGSIAELAQDDSIAMRLRFLDRVPPPAAMYFRGPVLSHFDGREWRPISPQLPARFPRRLMPQAELRVGGVPVPYEATIEPLKLAVLPLLEMTAEAPRIEGYTLLRRDDLQWMTERPVYDRLRFEAVAYTAFAHGPTEPVPGLEQFVELPEGYNPRTLHWAAELTRRPELQGADARALARAVLAHIRNEPFRYTLTPGLYGENDPTAAIDEFWLDRRQGFCEHFAAAFVVVMRAMGVPARVVTGYQGTDPEPVDGYWIVRQNAAHAWAEFWQPGIGWLRADPTAAVAPERVSRNQRLVRPPGVVAGMLGSMNSEFAAGLRERWEALNNRWNQWVLNYSRGDQQDLLERLGFSAPDWRDLAMLLTGVFGGFALAGVGWAAWERQRGDPWARQLARLRAELRTLAIDAADHHPPRTLARQVRERLGAEGEALATVLLELDAARYGREARTRPDSGLARRFAAEARRLRRQAA